MYYDPTYILVIIGAVLSLAASAKVKSTFAKYSRVASRSGLDGREAARRVLGAAGITNVGIQHVGGELSDHYDPRTKTVNLSDPVYAKTSIAAIAVAAHECGHAIQDDKQYFPLNFRSTLVPVANFGSMAAWPLIVIGLFINSNTGVFLLNLGIWAFSFSVLFQLVTLPVEFNASRRALAMLESNGLVPEDELPYAKKVLFAAALTYVAAAAASILQLLRLMMIANSRRD
ncbi:MAG: zinc metallopeptidase [Lachnospiraceae bacterium]|nr:zinc metallopeptidase [Lachnospiraceae bacterium]